MNDDSRFLFYVGDGTSISTRNLKPPSYREINFPDAASDYLAERGLRDAVNVALLLGQPLLVTGEPGTGKTQLASSVAHELGVNPPLVFNTKTTSTAKDLFYHYDSLAHFHDAQFHQEGLSVDKYITYEALGLAILLSLPPGEANSYLPANLKNKGPVRSVVLIDEIDKAPRDMPNDVLNEIENMSFTVKEAGRAFGANQDYRPIVILTSNSEKNLPEPFLRRCVFYHIAFPDKDRLKQIVQRRLKLNSGFTDQMVENALQHFMSIRKLEKLRKKPATAELLAWLRILEKKAIDVSDRNRAEEVAFSYSTLVKSKDDLELLRITPIEGQVSR
jgi:MoxR-like ATPase